MNKNLCCHGTGDVMERWKMSQWQRISYDAQYEEKMLNELTKGLLKMYQMGFPADSQVRNRKNNQEVDLGKRCHGEKQKYRELGKSGGGREEKVCM